MKLIISCYNTFCCIVVVIGCFSIKFPSNNLVSVTLRTNLPSIPTFCVCTAPTFQLSAILMTILEMYTFIGNLILIYEFIVKFMSTLTCRYRNIWFDRPLIWFQIFIDNIGRNKFPRSLWIVDKLNSFTFIKWSNYCVSDSITCKYLIKGV
jgi:hypothetical protein